MKTVQILVLAISISVAPVLVAGCCNSASCCGEDLESKPYYKITGWEPQIVRLDSTIYNGYTSVSELQIFSTDSLFYYKAGIKLSGMASYYTKVTGSGSLMACSPIPPGYKGSKETITAFKVVSSADYDTSHPAGSNLADILKIRIKDYLSSDIDAVQGLDAYLATNPQPVQFYTLLFTKAPETNKKHTFTITYKQSDGTEFTINTNELIFRQ